MRFGTSVGVIVAMLAVGAAGGHQPVTKQASQASASAMLRTNGITLRADARFRPQALPSRRYVPLDLRAWAKLSYAGPGLPKALTRMRLHMGRNGW